MSTAFVAPALAATTYPDPDPPPVEVGFSPGAYDLITGSYTYSTTEVVIGQPDAGGLAFTRTFLGGGWRDNYAGTINSSGSTYTVSTGSTSETFTLSGSTFTTVQGVGSTLTYDGSRYYTYTLRDGAVAIFDNTLANGGSVYDANVARITTLTKPSGEVITWTYNKTTGAQVGTRLQSVGNTLGYQLHFDYARNTNPTTSTELDQWRSLTKVTGINLAVEYCDPAGNTCSVASSWPYVTYGTSGSYSTATDNLGRVWQYSSGASGLVAIRRPTSPSANSITITYASGRVSTISNGVGTWSYTYADASGQRTTTITDPLSHTRVVVSNIANLQILSDTDGAGHTTSYQYDGVYPQRVTRVTLPEGNYTSYGYDGRGNVNQTTVVAKSGSGISNIVTSAAFDTTCSNPFTCNQPNSTTDARGFRTDYTYDSTHGGVTSVTQPAPSGSTPVGSGTRPETRYSYTQLYAHYKNSGGSIVAAPTAVYRLTGTSSCATSTWSSGACGAGSSDETITTITYGSTTTSVANNLLPTATTAAAGDGSLSATTDATYTDNGDVASVDGPLSGTVDKTVFWYDADRERIGVVGPDPDGGGSLANRAIRTTYNADGQVTSVEQGTVTTQSTWPTTFTTLLTQNTTYNAQTQPVTQTLVGGGSIQQMVQYEYDAAGRLLCTAQRINPAYFASPNTAACTLTLVASGLGPDRVSRNTYDNAGRTTKVTAGYGSLNQVDAWTATYTNNGLQATLTDANGNVTNYVYDGVDRLSCIRYAGASCSSTNDYEQYSYDANSNVTQDRRRDASTLSATYDNLNRVTLTDASDSTPDVSHTYDLFDRLLTQYTSAQTLTFTYDQLSRNLSQQHSVLGTVSYQYDLAGRRTRMTWPDALYVAYDYDNADDLTAIRENGATSGAGVLATYSCDNLGRVTLLTRGSGATETPTYDDASNLASLAQDLANTANDNTIAQAHNAFGGITSRTNSNTAYQWSPISPATTNSSVNGLNQYTSVGGASQTYDSRGNLTTGSFGYDIYNRLTSGPNSAALSYDPTGRLYQTSATSFTTTRFLYDGPDIIGEYDTSGNLLRRYVSGLVWYEGSGTSDRRYLIQDERGSVIAVDANSGVSINTYDEYGNNGSSNAGRFQYAGTPWLAEIGIYHMGARDYAPSIGRFLQTDPILTAGGVNLYAYTANDPVNAVDPSGLMCTGSILPNCGESGSSGGAGIGHYNYYSSRVTGTDPYSGNQLDLHDRWYARWIPGVSPGGSYSGFGLSRRAFGGLTAGARGGGEVGGDDDGESAPCAYASAQACRMIGVQQEAGGLDELAQLGDILYCGGDGCDWTDALGVIPFARFLRTLGCGCFVEGTEVMTPDGLRPIEDIQVGDLVMAWDPETQTTSPQRVEALIRPDPKLIWRLETRDADGETEVFEVTDDHPWYVADAGWIETQNLHAGQRIETGDDSGLLILDVAVTDRIERTYNLTVTGPHTFLVGEDGAVVHNNTCWLFHGHHAWPKYLGGPMQQQLVTLGNRLHTRYHQGLNRVLGGARVLTPQVGQRFVRYTAAFDRRYGTNLLGAARAAGFPY